MINQIIDYSDRKINSDYLLEPTRIDKLSNEPRTHIERQSEVTIDKSAMRTNICIGIVETCGKCGLSAVLLV